MADQKTTIRLPSDLLARYYRLKAEDRAVARSLQALVVEALEKELTRREKKADGSKEAEA